MEAKYVFIEENCTLSFIFLNAGLKIVDKPNRIEPLLEGQFRKMIMQATVTKCLVQIFVGLCLMKCCIMSL